MIKYTILIFLLIIGCNNQLSKKVKDCNPTVELQLPINSLKNDLLGVWNYRYSYKNDTCFQISQLGDLPRKFEFAISNKDSMKITYLMLYNFAKEKLLFGLISFHEEKPFGNSSYPLVNTISKDSSLIRITHYVEGSSLGKGYSYFMTSLSKDTLVLKNERNYHVDEKKITGVEHVYTKEN